MGFGNFDYDVEYHDSIYHSKQWNVTVVDKIAPESYLFGDTGHSEKFREIWTAIYCYRIVVGQ